jgi:hypothetical protein
MAKDNYGQKRGVHLQSDTVSGLKEGDKTSHAKEEF